MEQSKNLVIFLFILLSASAKAYGHSLDPKAAKLCQAAHNPSLCVSSIEPILRGKKVDDNLVLKASLKACKDEFKHAIKEAKSIPRNHSKFTGQILDDCREEYDLALTNIQDAFRAIDRNDVHSLKSRLSAISTHVTTCDDAFKERPEAGTPLQQVNEKLSDLASNSLSISATIHEA